MTCKHCGRQIEMHMGWWKDELDAGLCPSREGRLGAEINHQPDLPDLTDPADVEEWLRGA